LREFVEDGDEVDIRMRVSEEGEWEGVLKLRQGDNREFFDIKVEVDEGEIVEEVEVDDDVEKEENVVLIKKESEVAVLNEIFDERDSGESKVVYESRDWKVVNGLVYGFCVFLICIVGLLIWERF
jgi:hypothetical protein